MADKPQREKTADPGQLQEQRKDLDAESLRNQAALREQPEDRRESARQSTPAGKARSR